MNLVNEQESPKLYKLNRIICPLFVDIEAHVINWIMQWKIYL